MRNTLLLFLMLTSTVATAAEKGTGKDLLRLFAYNCKAASFKKLHSAALRAGFDKLEVESPVYKKENDTLQSADGKMSVRYVDSKFEVTADGKTYVGRDVCETTLAMARDSAKKEASLWNAVLPTAHAEDLLANRNSWGEKVTGGAFLLGGAVVAGLGASGGPAAWYFIGAGVTAAAGGANEIRLSFNRDAAHRRFQTILNSDFRLLCDSQSITLQNSTEKLVLRSHPRRRDRAEGHITISNLQTQAQERVATNASPEAGKLLTDLLKSCRSESDAQFVRSLFRSDDARRNIAQLLNSGASENVIEKASNSNR